MKNLYHSIRWKLLGGFIFISIFVIPLSFIYIQDLKKINLSFNTVVNRTIPSIYALIQLKNDAAQIQILTANFSLSGGESTQSEGTKAASIKYELLSYQFELEKWLKEYMKLNKEHNAEKIKKLDVLTKIKDDFILTALNVFEAYENKLPVQKIDYFRERLHQLEEKLVNNINALVFLELESSKDKTTEMQISTENMIKIAMLICILTIIFSCLISVFLIKIISRPILQYIQSQEKIAELNRKLVKISRQAGMAEVSISVLHNVGNVLNSVNVSKSVLFTKFKELKLTQLEKIALLLQKHQSELGTFFSTHEKGKHVIGYLTLLAKHWAQEQKIIFSELELLDKNVEHIRNVIVMQQSMSKVGGVVESIHTREIIHDILTLHQLFITPYNIIVDYKNTINKHINIDKLKLEQILINLIRNAIDSLIQSNDSIKILTIKDSISDENNFIIKISDNGQGIAPENLTKVFNFGFTTKKDGHGFGLHSSILAAIELGGTLTVTSKGLNQGAEFTLTLPLSAKEISQKKPAQEIYEK